MCRGAVGLLSDIFVTLIIFPFDDTDNTEFRIFLLSIFSAFSRSLRMSSIVDCRVPVILASFVRAGRSRPQGGIVVDSKGYLGYAD